MATIGSMVHIKPSSLSVKLNVPFLAFWLSYLAGVGMFFLGYVLS
jgi:hypothetical protein